MRQAVAATLPKDHHLNSVACGEKLPLAIWRYAYAIKAVGAVFLHISKITSGDDAQQLNLFRGCQFAQRFACEIRPDINFIRCAGIHMRITGGKQV
ncbi:hypothetical protein D3C80_1773760 [compost metagenome]